MFISVTLRACTQSHESYSPTQQLLLLGSMRGIHLPPAVAVAAAVAAAAAVAEQQQQQHHLLGRCVSLRKFDSSSTTLLGFDIATPLGKADI